MSKSQNKRIESKRNLKKLKEALENGKFRKTIPERQVMKSVKIASFLILLFIASFYISLISCLFIY